MSTTKNRFSPSVNIERDRDIALNYIPTQNAKHTASQISNDYLLGVRSFNIIGAYGTGKSSFLWAFEKTLSQEKNFFSLNPHFKSFKGFEIVRFIGEFDSVTKRFAFEFDKEDEFTPTTVIQAIDAYYQTLAAKGKGLIIIIDEFGKFLEYAAKHEPERELYFFQQLAEYANDVSKEVCLITTLHQDFNAYSLDLSKSQRNEWSKVKGRLKELTFNEPVEHLLFLASERIKNLDDQISEPKGFKKLFDAIKISRAFPLRDYLNLDIAKSLLPLDILAASILTLSLQRYGQNERSLFSFIETDDHLGLRERIHKGYYNVANVYDYLSFNFPILNTKHNPHFVQWVAIKNALERVEGLIEENNKDHAALVKTIGLLNIFSSASASINDKLLESYGKNALEIKDPNHIISDLERFKIIRFVKHTAKYVLFEGTDLDIELAIDEAGNLVELVTNVVGLLNDYFDFPIVLAKASYFEKGTPRFFEYRLTEYPIIKEHPVGEIDGFINLVFSDETEEKEVQSRSAETKEAILYCFYAHTQDIRNLLFEIRKVEKVIENNREDRIAVRELKTILEHQIRLLNHYVIDSLYSNDGKVKWYYRGQPTPINSERELNQLLSQITLDVYEDTPEFRNELVNKTKLSSPIRTALKSFIRAMVDYGDQPGWGFPENNYPPEKTIYLSLIVEKGMIASDTLLLQKPTDTSFHGLWEACKDFLDTTKTGKRNIRELIDLLTFRPYKLKKGLVDFWIPLFIYSQREEFALFEGDVYIPYITDQTLEVLLKNPHKYYLKAFDIEGINLLLFQEYRSLLNQKQERPSTQAFIDTIRPFLTFYRGLPDYAKNTERLSGKAKNVRAVIAKAKDPEKVFFVSFPKALGYSTIQLAENQMLLDEYIDTLQEAIKELRTAYTELQTRFENFIRDFLGLPTNGNYITALQSRFSHVKEHLLKPQQKVFYQRINTDLDTKSWISAIAQACLGKILERIDDNDEAKLYDQFREYVRELDNVAELSTALAKNGKDDYIVVDLQSLEQGRKKQIIAIPFGKKRQITEQKQRIRALLDQDIDVNIATLTNLLNELLDERS